MQHNVYIYILVMGIVTYLIRVLPLTLIRREMQPPATESQRKILKQPLMMS